MGGQRRSSGRSSSGSPMPPLESPTKRQRRDSEADDEEAEAEYESEPHHDDSLHDTSQNRRSSRRSGLSSYSLSQPEPSSASSRRSRPVSSSHPSADDSIDFIVEGEAADGADAASTDLPTSSSSHPFSPPPVLEALPLDERVEEWLQPITAMTEERRQPKRVLEAQSRSERIQVRSMYSVVLEQTRTNPEFNNEDSIRRGVQIANRMNEAVCHVTEEMQDAEEISTLAGKGYEKARKQLQSDSSFDLRTYLDALLVKFAEPKRRDEEDDRQQIDWIRLGEACEGLAHTALVTSFLRGVFFHQTAVKAKAKRRKREEEELKETSATEVTSEEGLVAKQTQLRQAYVKSWIHKLTKDKAVSVWRLLVDPTSFVRTVENFFDFSFAVRDGVIRLCDWDEEGGYPMVRWRITEAQRVKQIRQTKTTLERLTQKLQQRQSEGDAADADLSPQAREDSAALRRARRVRREKKLQRLLQRMKEMEAAGTLAEKTAKVKEDIAREKAQAVRDSDPRNIAHFTPVLDYHVWSGMVVKLKLSEPLIPPMTAEEEVRWAKRLSKGVTPTATEENPQPRKQRRIDEFVRGGMDEEKEEAEDDENGKDERKEDEEEEEEYKETADDNEIEFITEE